MSGLYYTNQAPGADVSYVNGTSFQSAGGVLYVSGSTEILVEVLENGHVNSTLNISLFRGANKLIQHTNVSQSLFELTNYSSGTYRLETTSCSGAYCGLSQVVFVIDQNPPTLPSITNGVNGSTITNSTHLNIGRSGTIEVAMGQDSGSGIAGVGLSNLNRKSR